MSKKDFLMRIKISRKEAKEARYWLQLIMPHDNQSSDQQQLVQEATELLMIFTAILRKTEGSGK
jgi:four helix bundle protein